VRSTPGADTANIGAWAAGSRGAALAQALVEPNGPRVAFAVLQNTEIGTEARGAVRELRARKLPVLGLYGGPAAVRKSATLRNAMGGRRGAMVRTYRTAGADLLVPNGFVPQFGPGLPGDLLEWMRGR
jgi:hypothetical protein